MRDGVPTFKIFNFQNRFKHVIVNSVLLFHVVSTLHNIACYIPTCFQKWQHVSIQGNYLTCWPQVFEPLECHDRKFESFSRHEHTSAFLTSCPCLIKTNWLGKITSCYRLNISVTCVSANITFVIHNHQRVCIRLIIVKMDQINCTRTGHLSYGLLTCSREGFVCLPELSVCY
jgi:hypothetical protein